MNTHTGCTTGVYISNAVYIAYVLAYNISLMLVKNDFGPLLHTVDNSRGCEVALWHRKPS